MDAEENIRADVERIESWQGEVERRVEALTLAIEGSLDGGDAETVARLRRELLVLQARLVAMGEQVADLRRALARMGVLSEVEVGRLRFCRWLHEQGRMGG